MTFNEQAYRKREKADFRATLANAEKGTKAELSKVQAEFLMHMASDPELVETAIKNLLRGDHGDGAKYLSREIVSSSRTAESKIDTLLGMAAAAEWTMPQVLAQDSVRALREAQRDKVYAHVKAAIEFGKRKIAEERAPVATGVRREVRRVSGRRTPTHARRRA